MSDANDRWLSLLQAIADRADAIALELFGRADLQVEDKPDLSPVSEADRRIEAVARQLVRERAPSLGVIGEEEGDTSAGRADRLIIDPIDATRNFVRGIPVFATLLAVESDEEVVAGVVSAPALGSRWHAARGRGAWCGDRRLAVSTLSELSEAQLFHGELDGIAETGAPESFRHLMRATARTRGFGDFYQHVLVASGCGEVAFDAGVHVWDVAPLQVIVEEAGGHATTVDGVRDIRGGTLLCTNARLRDAVLERLRGS